MEWKILGGKELAEIANYQGSDRNLRKMLSRAEQENILKSFVHKFNNRKYYYFSRTGHNEFSTERWNINEDIKMHDAIVGSVLYQFSKLEMIRLSKINDQNIEFNQSIFSHGIDPDGMIRAKKGSDILNIAIEIELTRKNSTEIFRKFNLYHSKTCYFWAIYFFPNKRILETYTKYYSQFCRDNDIQMNQRMMMFCWSDELAAANINILNINWLRPDGVDSKLSELFL